MSAAAGRLVFFGNERLATGVSTDAPTLRRLIAAGYDVALVVSHHSATTSRRARELEIAAVAAEHNIPVLLPAKPADIRSELAAPGAAAAVLVAYGKIVPQSIIDLFPCGILNIHPSLLPLHRGPTPIESVILDGSPQTGVSVMQLAAAMDAGPVYGQRPLALDGHETKQALADTLLDMGGELLLELLPDALAGSIDPQPQNDEAATYDQLLQKTDGELHPAEQSALQSARAVRAYAGWPGTRLRIGQLDTVITEARVTTPNESLPAATPPGSLQPTADRSAILLATIDGTLAITRLKPAGKADMPARAFLAGHKLA